MPITNIGLKWRLAANSHDLRKSRRQDGGEIWNIFSGKSPELRLIGTMDFIHAGEFHPSVCGGSAAGKERRGRKKGVNNAEKVTIQVHRLNPEDCQGETG
jgi:hypothetical protein